MQGKACQVVAEIDSLVEKGSVLLGARRFVKIICWYVSRVVSTRYLFRVC